MQETYVEFVGGALNFYLNQHQARDLLLRSLHTASDFLRNKTEFISAYRDSVNTDEPNL